MQRRDSLVGRKDEERKWPEKNGNSPKSGFAVHECGDGTGSRPSKAKYPTESFHHAAFAVAWFTPESRCVVASLDDVQEVVRNEFAH